MKLNERVATASLVILFTAAIQVAAIAKEKTKPAQTPATQEELVWPAPPAPARIKWTGEIRNEFDVGAKKRHSFVDRLAGKGQDALWIRRPIGVAVDDNGFIVVGDFGQGLIGIDPKAHKMWLFSQVSKTSLPTPAGVAMDSKLVYACDANTNTFAVFDKEGHFLKGLGVADGIKRPVGVAVDEARDLILVVNGGENQVLMLDRNLKLIKKIGTRGSKPGQFNFPTYCTFIPGTGFAVTDTGNFRVQIFDYDGRFIRSFGEAGDMTGKFARPKGIAVDPDGNLYVTDATFQNFQVFRQDGQLLTYVGRGGAAPAQFQIPAGIAISKDGAIFAADEINGRIQTFQYLGKGGAQAEGKQDSK